MRIAFLIAIAIVTAGCSRQLSTDAARSKPTSSANSEAGQSAVPIPTIETQGDQDVAIRPLTSVQQQQLLNSRLDGGMDFSFNQFSNAFLASSLAYLDFGVSLMTSSPEIGQTTLQSPFPRFYKPTLREFLDAIALQTFSEWKYDPTNKYFEVKGQRDAPIEGIAIFEFKIRDPKREKPFEVTLAGGWQASDKGNWLMLVPPTFPVGLDIYEMGSFSADAAEQGTELLKRVPTEVALEWAQRVRKDAKLEDLKLGKVGRHDALFFESMIPSHLGKDVRWRQWVFMIDHQCYFVVSTILPEFDREIFPDVEEMLASFKAKK